MLDANEAPLGRWTGTVSYEGQTDEYTIEFAEDGTVSLDTPASTGQGIWTESGQGAFAFVVKEEFKRDEAGNLPPKVLPGAAYIDIEIEARRTGPNYAGAGVARIRMADGTAMHTTSVETAAHLVQVRQQA